jgi:hypothetical protein
MGLDDFIVAIREEIDTKVAQPSLVVVEPEE